MGRRPDRVDESEESDMASSSPTEDSVEFSRSEGELAVLIDWAILCREDLNSGGGGGGGGEDSDAVSSLGDRDGVGLMPLSCSMLEKERDPVEDCRLGATINEEELTRSRLRCLSLLPTPRESSRWGFSLLLIDFSLSLASASLVSLRKIDGKNEDEDAEVGIAAASGGMVTTRDGAGDRCSMFLTRPTQEMSVVCGRVKPTGGLTARRRARRPSWQASGYRPWIDNI